MKAFQHSAAAPSTRPADGALLGERRRVIVEALDRCIRAKGYAHTSLNDLAAEAGMSPSHLHYYFTGKEAVLELYLRVAGDTLLADVRAFAADPPDAHIDAIAAYFFGGRLAGSVDQGVVLELFGQSVHRPGLRRIKAGFDRGMKAHLTDLFRETPRLAGLRAEDAAESAFALLTGFVATSYFDDRLTVARARALFRDGVRRLAGLPRTRARTPRKDPLARGRGERLRHRRS